MVEEILAPLLQNLSPELRRKMFKRHAEAFKGSGGVLEQVFAELHLLSTGQGIAEKIAAVSDKPLFIVDSIHDPYFVEIPPQANVTRYTARNPEDKRGHYDFVEHMQDFRDLVFSCVKELDLLPETANRSTGVRNTKPSVNA